MKKSKNISRSRRNFIEKTAVASSFLFVQGLHGSALSGISLQSKKAKAGFRKIAMNSPVIVVTESVSSDVNPRAVTWTYITEILQRAGIFFESSTPSGLSTLTSRTNSIVVLAGDLRLTSEQKKILTAMVNEGGSLIGIGGTSGMDKEFGVKDKHALAEGWMKITDENHSVTKELRSSLHVFGGNVYVADTATSLAKMEENGQCPQGSAILENNFGKGQTVLLAPDLIFSIVHIQQGIPVLQDGRPAPDGSAAVNDGILKAEDGSVLDWERDRTIMHPDDGLAFLEPITDELREIILRSLFHMASLQGITLPVLWYWPRSLQAVGYISHDSDNNEAAKAEAMLEVIKNCKVKSTWCIIKPGYPKSFYGKLKEQGYEVALHYDAKTGGELTSWSKENFFSQHSWLSKEAGLDHITSNKNHYTRWENRLDYYRWCEEIGINTDQTRGPSKKGTIGFPLGGSQPYFPIDDEVESPRIMNVLEINLITQDLVVVCPKEYGRQFVDSVLRHHGVAHFLFHPAHILKPNVADALAGLVDYGRAQGLEWWTSEQIFNWEKLRRNVSVKFDPGNKFTLRTDNLLSEATVMFLKTGKELSNINIDGKTHKSESRTIYGFEFDVVTQDLNGQNKFELE